MEAIELKKSLVLIMVVMLLCSSTLVFAAEDVNSAMYEDERATGDDLTITEVEVVLTDAGVQDVEPDSYAAGSIAVMLDAGLMAPDEEGNFDPEGQLSNNTAYAIFARIAGLADSTVSDEEAAAIAIENGLLPDDSDSDLAEPITRMEMARLIFGSLGYSVTSDFLQYMNAQFGGNDAFADIGSLSESDRAILNYLYSQGLALGYLNNGIRTYQPNDYLSRQEMAIFADRLLGNT